MKTIVITRKYWGTGRLCVDGKQCCLGFCARSFGVPVKDLLGYGSPAELSPNHRKKLPDWMLKQKPDYDSDVQRAMFINDNATLTMVEKEELLKPLFLKHGIKLVFRGSLS
jgi:hypothetical protein